MARSSLARINEIDAEQKQLTSKMHDVSEEVQRLSHLDELTPGEEERLSRVRRGFARSMMEHEALQDERLALIADAGRPGSGLIAMPGTPFGDEVPRIGGREQRGRRRHGPEAMRRADPWDFSRPIASPLRPEQVRGEVRERALTAIERCERLSEAAREAATRNIERDQDPGSRLALYTVAASDPDYYSAFASWFRDPLSGQYEWSPEQRDAFRLVQSMTRSMALGTGSAGGFPGSVRAGPEHHHQWGRVGRPDVGRVPSNPDRLQ